MPISKSLRALMAAITALVVLGACERGAEQPAGPVILTASGAIGETNRGPYDETRDTFFKYHEISFEKAFEFDREMLLLLDQQRLTAAPPEVGKSVTFQGPSLKSVLKALGAEKAQYIRFVGLDGYATELNAEAIKSKDWIVAVDADGRPLEIGRQGPIWVMFRPDNPLHISENEDLTWPWAVFYMEVK